MTIKDRLRDRRIVAHKMNEAFKADGWHGDIQNVPDPLCVEAADEIERLERENAQLKADFVKARNDALEEAAVIASKHFIPNHSVISSGFANMCAENIRALKEKP